MLVVNLGQLPEIGVCQALLEGKEACVDGLSIKTSKRVENSLAVSGSDGSHHDGRSILEGFGSTVVSNIDH
jgi:hypothetical protein